GSPGDWSSDVCSSDLPGGGGRGRRDALLVRRPPGTGQEEGQEGGQAAGPGGGEGPSRGVGDERHESAGRGGVEAVGGHGPGRVGDRKSVVEGGGGGGR